MDPFPTEDGLTAGPDAIEGAPLTVLYEGRLMQEISFTRNLSELFYGTIPVSNVSVVLKNHDNALFNVIDIDEQNEINQKVTIHSYDFETGIATLEWSGVISSISIAVGQVILEGSDVDVSLFEQQFPIGNHIIDTDRWPNAVDVGKLIPLVFGFVDRLPLPFINNDSEN